MCAIVTVSCAVSNRESRYPGHASHSWLICDWFDLIRETFDVMSHEWDSVSVAAEHVMTWHTPYTTYLYTHLCNRHHVRPHLWFHLIRDWSVTDYLYACIKFRGPWAKYVITHLCVTHLVRSNSWLIRDWLFVCVYKGALWLIMSWTICVSRTLLDLICDWSAAYNGRLGLTCLSHVSIVTDSRYTYVVRELCVWREYCSWLL